MPVLFWNFFVIKAEEKGGVDRWFSGKGGLCCLTVINSTLFPRPIFAGVLL